MGTTIRRQPVSFRIPASPDYKFLNIGNFNGLEITDNPLNTDHTKASDALNVYVDETNTLTTRPRLEERYDFKKSYNITNLTGVYNIKDALLIHGDGKMYKLSMLDDISVEITGAVPTEKCVVFEENGEIYLLNTEGYKKITQQNKIEEVKPHIPEHIVNGEIIEPLNILTNEYKQFDFWDGKGLSTLPIKTSDVVKYENNYYKTIEAEDDKTKKVFEWYDDNTFIATREVVYDSTDDYMVLGKYDSNTNEVTYHSELDDGSRISIDSFRWVRTAPNKKSFWLLSTYRPGSPFETHSIYFYNFDEKTQKWKSSENYIEFSNKNEIIPESLGISANGTYFWFVSRNGDVVKTQTYKHDTTTNEISLHKEIFENLFLFINKSETQIYSVDRYAQEDIKTIYKHGIDSDYSTKTQFTEINTSEQYYSYTGWLYITEDENTVLLADDGIHDYVYYKQGDVLKTLHPKIFTQPFTVSRDETYAISQGQRGFALYLDFTTGEIIDTGIALENLNNALYTARFYLEKGLVIPLGTSLKIKKYTESEQPQIISTKTLGQAKTEDLQDLKNKLLASKITTRFDNNRWFATGGSVMHTFGNDVTYLPLDRVESLGNVKENITAFNLIQDTALVAYKDNQIFVITKADTSTYLYTESKNTVGNNAENAAIITTLTETPLQISYDGIFALNQLENVQSSDRISVLISTSINQRWLKEQNNIITQAKTANRLYWTFIALPYNDFTKVYVLDNRTNSWWYWELPIVVKDFFTKDLLIGEKSKEKLIFVDDSGKVYSMETTEIPNKYNPEVTEYYDLDNELINWYWKSQILPMGTINYSKKLIDSTFIVTDTDESDEFGLNYKFRAFRRSVSETAPTTISNTLNLVQSVTKKTFIPRFNFVQLELSNIEDDLNNNKLRLVGLGLKYVLLEGLL